MTKRRKGEVVTLQCARCHWGTELPLAETAESTSIACAHCGERIFWHRCEQCGLCYVGSETPCCPSCEDSALDDIEFS